MEEILQLQKDVEKLTNSAKLSDTLQDVDQIIALLSEAREKVAAGELNWKAGPRDARRLSPSTPPLPCSRYRHPSRYLLLT